MPTLLRNRSFHSMKKDPPKPYRKPVRPRTVQTHEVRIIGGLFKRTKLPVADKPGLRPTPDRVRETLFNWLGQDLTGWRCLDAFAGTGALGFESVSRGAKAVQLVDNDPALVAQFKRVVEQLKLTGVQVLRGDGLASLRQALPASLEVIFLDPPFDSEVFDAAVLAAGQAVATNGFVYLEAPTRWTDERLQAAHLQVVRYLKAGAVHAHLLRRNDAAGV
jgi:16S rRNA (guanine966-N2)-methyltransferase